MSLHFDNIHNRYSISGTNMSTIQIRIDDKTKKAANKILGHLGIDMSAAIKVYLKQIIIRQGIPFSLITENGLSPLEEQEILIAEQEALKGINVSKAMSPKEAINYLNKL